MKQADPINVSPMALDLSKLVRDGFVSRLGQSLSEQLKQCDDIWSTVAHGVFMLRKPAKAYHYLDIRPDDGLEERSNLFEETERDNVDEESVFTFPEIAPITDEIQGGSRQIVYGGV